MKLLRRVALVFAALLVAAPMLIQRLPSVASADSCAFPFKPTTYEDLKNRSQFLQAIDLASFNLLFPGDKDFGIPDLKVGPRNARSTMPGTVPPALMKSIAWIESSITQGDGTSSFGSIGPALVSFDCGHGISQVTSGMTLPAGEDGRGTPAQALVATNFAYNIARGTWILADKWNGGGEKLPIAGTDTNGFPMILENWYFAVWAYNGFTGPGASRSNHPLDPIYGTWPRTPYSCGPTSDGKGHNRSNYPYQEMVFGCVTNPPVVEGKYLWQTQPITLPDLNNAQVKSALSLANFVFPYTKMDIMTPQPLHADNTPKPDASLRSKILGNPQMSLGSTTAKVGYDPSSGSTVEVVDINNTGTGVLTWYATSSVPWLQVLPYTGVAVGSDLQCTDNTNCDRQGHLQLAIDANKAPPGKQKVTVTVQALGSSQQQTITVDVQQVVRLGAPGISRSR
jgi:hypothetical protein